MIADQAENNTSQRTERHWQLQSEEVSNALVRNGVGDDHRISGNAGVESFTYTIRGHMNVGVSKLRSIVQDLVQSLNIEGIRAIVRGDELQMFIPRSADVAVPMLDLLARHKEVPKTSATLGLCEDGSTIFHDFSSPDTPHLLVVGGQDAGKTVMLRSIAASLAIYNRQSEIQLAAISPVIAEGERQQLQTAAWHPLNYLPHMLCDVAFRHTEIIELLAFLSQEIDYREDHSFQEPRLIVLIDQVDVLLKRGGRTCAEPILRMAQKGEDVGIHLVLSTHSIDSATFGTQLMKEMSTRLIGRPDTGLPEQHSTIQRSDDVQQLLGEGDFLHRQGNQIRRLQGSYIDDYDLHLKLTQMVRRRAILLARPAETRLRLNQASQDQAPPVLWPSNNVDQMTAVAS